MSRIRLNLRSLSVTDKIAKGRHVAEEVAEVEAHYRSRGRYRKIDIRSPGFRTGSTALPVRISFSV